MSSQGKSSVAKQAIIVDLDGTLCQSQRVDQFKDASGSVDWSAWMKSNAYAPVNEWCRAIVNGAISQGTHIIFLTSRVGNPLGLAVTDNWLVVNGFSGYTLLMRKEKETRLDTVVKQDIYNSEIAPYYEVLFAIDDKRTVVDMWRMVGVPALHCADY